MTDHKVDVHIARLQPGTLVDVTIKGVEFAYERTIDHSTGAFSIRDEHGRRYTMPPQAAITRHTTRETNTPDDTGEKVSAVLSYLDAMEAEGYTQPYIAATVRKTLGLPPRHWPPQPGDVWHDGLPYGFFAPLWFARKLQADGPGWSETAIVMTNVEADRVACSPEELLQSSDTLTLLYRHKDSGQ